MLKPVKDYPALLHIHKQHRTLIIADLHLGWEIGLSKKGIHVPSQTGKILQKLLETVDTANPNTLVILGDVKHTIAKAESGEWKDIPEFFEALQNRISDIQIIRGNHDGNLEPLLPPNIRVHPPTGIVLNTVGLFHGHTWPARKLLSCRTLVMGHAHPTVALRDSLGFQMTTPVWVKIKSESRRLEAVYLKSQRAETRKAAKRYGVKPRVKQLLMMPCFNDFLGGRPVNKKSEHKSYVGPILRSEATNVNKGEVYLLDGTFLGTVEQLRALS
jgi:hypothetical protein